MTRRGFAGGARRRSRSARRSRAARRCAAAAAALDAGDRRDPRLCRAHRDRLQPARPDARADRSRRLLERASTFRLRRTATRGRRSRADTLFQVGSISQADDAPLVIHQFAAEGRFALTRPDRRAAARPFRCPRATRSPSSICSTMSPAFPADAPLFPPGGLWTGFTPGQPLVLFEHRLRHARQARRACRRQAARASCSTSACSSRSA